MRWGLQKEVTLRIQIDRSAEFSKDRSQEILFFDWALKGSVIKAQESYSKVALQFRQFSNAYESSVLILNANMG